MNTQIRQPLQHLEHPAPPRPHSPPSPEESQLLGVPYAHFLSVKNMSLGTAFEGGDNCPNQSKNLFCVY